MSTTVCHHGVKELAPMLLQRRYRAILVGLHQPRVANHGGGKDCGKAAFDIGFGHVLSLTKDLDASPLIAVQQGAPVYCGGSQAEISVSSDLTSPAMKLSS